jgi:hypothetical protein
MAIDGEAEELRPELDGPFWLIGDNPDLGSLQGKTQQCVDHHMYQSPDDAWHLWGCIRHTAVGRVLYHWEGNHLVQHHWRQTGEVLRADQEFGESLGNWRGEEWIQSPFFVREGGILYMFYGGHSTGADEKGTSVPPEDPRTACQICLMTSTDGRTWERHEDGEGHSRVFSGPGLTRDPCLINIAGLWHIYYAGYDKSSADAGIFMRTSLDLIHWSRWTLVHQDFRYGFGAWGTECPHVVKRGGYYYLFRTEAYAAAKTHVFRSEDPADFGIGDAKKHYVGPLAVAAPEIIVDAYGHEYISSSHDLAGGIRMCKLKWVAD